MASHTQNCLLVILGQVRGHTHPRDFARRLAGEPTISPRVQWTCPRKSCHGGGGSGVVTYSWVETDKVLGQREGEFRCVRKSNKEF